MPNNPLLPADILNYYQWSAQNGINPPQLPAAYVMATDPAATGILALRLFDAAYITTGIINRNRLGTGSTGAGNLYLADDGTWKAIGGGGVVTRIIAGTNISISPLGGTGDVTINAVSVGSGTTSNVLIDGGTFTAPNNALIDAGGFI